MAILTRANLRALSYGSFYTFCIWNGYYWHSHLNDVYRWHDRLYGFILLISAHKFHDSIESFIAIFLSLNFRLHACVSVLFSRSLFFNCSGFYSQYLRDFILIVVVVLMFRLCFRFNSSIDW